MLQRELLGLTCSLLAILGGAFDWYPYNVDSWAAGEGAQEVCRKGHMQSPVELPNCEARPRSPINLDYGSHMLELMNNGHTVQLTLHDEQGSASRAVMKVGGATYKLIQCHFHWGSEHTIGGKQQAMVAHCVHLKDAAGREMRFGVLAIFYEVGAVADPFLRLIENKLPQASHAEGETTFSSFKGPVNFDLAYKGLNMTHYWTYPGSLTTPPCTEAVDWFPLMTKQVMSREQYQKFKSAIGWKSAGGNYRPPNFLHGRIIDGCLWGPQAPKPGMFDKHASEWYPYDSRTWASDVGTLSSDTCRRGQMQSPVELPVCEVAAKREVIKIDWGTHPVELLNNGHTVQLTLNNTMQEGQMVVNDATYKLIQCHFHWGSEHTIGNEQQDMVAHCVHVKKAKGREMRFGVLAIFYKVGKEVDPFLASFENQLPDRPTPSTSAKSHRRLSGKKEVANFTGPIDFNLAFNGLDLSHYWTYPGSLTTPPCTEAVDWYPLMQRKVMSKEQYNKFKVAIGWGEEGGNFRPPQLLHGRQIVGCQEEKVVSVTKEDTNWKMTGGLVAAIVILATAVCAGLVYYMHRSHQRKLAYATTEGLPRNTPIVIRSLSKDGFIDEFEDSSTNKVYSRGEGKGKKPMWLVKEVQGFARQISPSLRRAGDSLQRQISPSKANRKAAAEAKASEEAKPSAAPSPLTKIAQESQEDAPHLGRPYIDSKPQPVSAQPARRPERSLCGVNRFPLDLSCFLPYFFQSKALPPPARAGARPEHYGKKDLETQLDDVMVGA